MTKPGDAEKFLSRWSRRKHAAAREPAARPVPLADTDAATQAPAPAVATMSTGEPGAPAAPAAPAVLPPVESLTFDSDYTAFLRPGVDPQVRQSALRTLLRDPHFNTMDGLDVYIDDYTKPSPISAATIASLVQARYIFAPPPTRVNADGFVEDVPEDEAKADAQATDAQPTDAQPTDAQPTDAQATDAQATDAQATDAQATDAHAAPAPAPVLAAGAGAPAAVDSVSGEAAEEAVSRDRQSDDATAAAARPGAHA